MLDNGKVQSKANGRPAAYDGLPEMPPQRSLRDVYYVLFRHKYKMILFFCGIVGLSVLATLGAAARYRSEAKLLVRIGRESVALDPTATTGQIINVGQSRESEINSELAILKSRELVEQVVDALGAAAVLNRASGTAPPRGAAHRSRAIVTLMDNLQIEAVKDSSIITVSHQAPSPRLARDVVEKLIEFYLDKHIAAHRTPGSHQFFSQLTGEVADNLAKAEQELQGFKNETGIASLTDQRRTLLERITSLQQEAERTDAALAASRSRTGALKTRLAQMPATITTEQTTGLADGTTELMRQRLYELQLQEQQLLSKFTQESEMVREVRRQIVEARKLLDQEDGTRTQVTTGVNQARQQTEMALLDEEATLASLAAQAGLLKAQLAGAEQEFKHLIDNETRLARLQREREMQETKFRRYSENLEQARVDQALEMEKISNISVVQSASLPLRPESTGRQLKLALGLLLAVFGSVGVALLFEYADHSLKTPQDVEEKLGLPTLVSIPRVSASKVSFTAKRRDRVKTSA